MNDKFMTVVKWYSAVIVTISIIVCFYDAMMYVDPDAVVGMIMYLPIGAYLWSLCVGDGEKKD